MKKNNEIIIFPQSIFSSVDTISKFKTGAFTTNINVQPVVIKYKQDVSSLSMFYMLLYGRLDVELYILKTMERNNMSANEYKNVVYEKMLEESGLLRSNISSYDVVDE